jgi:hypothetical protein
VPAKVSKLLVKPFEGKMKSAALSRVGKSIFQQFLKVPGMF